MAKYGVTDTLVVVKRLGGDAALRELDRRAQSLLRYVFICGAEKRSAAGLWRQKKGGRGALRCHANQVLRLQELSVRYY